MQPVLTKPRGFHSHVMYHPPASLPERTQPTCASSVLLRLIIWLVTTRRLFVRHQRVVFQRILPCDRKFLLDVITLPRCRRLVHQWIQGQKPFPLRSLRRHRSHLLWRPANANVGLWYTIIQSFPNFILMHTEILCYFHKFDANNCDFHRLNQ